MAIIEAAEPPYQTPIAALAMTGIRAGELLGLKRNDIDFLSKRMTIDEAVWRGKLQATKTAASNRIIAMPDALVALLASHHRHSQFTEPDDFVFCQADGRPINPDSLRKLGIYPALQRVGIPYRKRWSGCHAFRHTIGSIVHRETGSLKYAQMQLGHSKIATTGNIYTHVGDDEMGRVAEAIGKALSGFCGRSVVENTPEGERIQ